MRVRGIVKAFALAAVWLVLTSSDARAQATGLVLSSGPSIVCPAADAQVGVSFWQRTGSTQVIEAAAGVGTTIEFQFPARVVAARFLNSSSVQIPPGASLSISGTIATVRLRESVAVRNLSTAFGVLATLDLRSVRSGTPLMVTATVDPPYAVTFEGRVNVAARTIVDAAACQPAPATELTIDDLTSGCPTAAEVAAFNAALDIQFDSDPTAGTLVCRASAGSADLTRLQERTYQVLRVMKSLPFEVPLPWTSKSMYDWFIGAARGIRYRSEPGTFCCNPSGVINVSTNNLAILSTTTECCITASSTLVNLAGVLAHEARHNEQGPHTCGSNDMTLTELGAWGVQYYFSEWAAFRVGSFLTRRAPPPPYSYALYRQDAWGLALGLLAGGDCDCGPGGTLGGGVVTSPELVDFGAQALFASGPLRSVAITHTLGAPVTITGVRLSGAHPADFGVTSPSCAGAVLPPSCPVVLRFMPSAAGTRTAQLTATLSNGLERAVELRGTGRP